MADEEKKELENEESLEAPVEEKEESFSDAIVDWVLEELKESGTMFLEKLTESQIERIRETIIDLAGLGLLAAMQKDKREEHLREIQIVINTLNADAALAVVNAQNEVRSAFQRVFFKIGGGFFQ